MPILTEGFLVIHRSTQPTETLQVLLSNLRYENFTPVYIRHKTFSVLEG